MSDHSVPSDGAWLEATLGPLTAKLELAVDAISKQTASLDRLIAFQAAYQQDGPIQLRLRGTGTSNSAGDSFTIDLGGPATMRLWEIRGVVVGGLTWSSTVSGTAELYIGSNVSTARPLSEIVDQASGSTPSLPSVATYSSGQVVLRNPEHLYLVIVSPTASTQYLAGARGFDVPDRPARRVADL